LCFNVYGQERTQKYGDGTNYTEFADNGTVTLHGTARAWVSEDLTPSNIGKPSTHPPGATYYQDGPFDAYDDTTEQQVFFIWRVKHSFATGAASVRGWFDGMVATDPAGQTEYIAMGFQYTKITDGVIFDITTPDGGGAVNITQQIN